MKQVGIFLYQFHRFYLLDHGFCRHLVFRFTAFFFKMPRISNIPHVTDLIAQMKKVPVNHIKCDESAGMTEMTLATDGGTAYIHAHMLGSDGNKFFLLSCIR